MMKNHLRTLFVRRNAQYALAGLILLLLLIAYPCRGFIRTTVLPSAAKVLYASGVHKVTDKASGELQDAYPFGRITYPSDTSSCNLSDAHYLKTGIFCNRYLFRGQVSIKDVLVDDFERKAHQFERSLEMRGWTAQDSQGKINRSYEPPYNWWYSVHYTKSFGKVNCRLTVERDNDPNVLDAYIDCDRQVIFF